MCDNHYFKVTLSYCVICYCVYIHCGCGSDSF